METNNLDRKKGIGILLIILILVFVFFQKKLKHNAIVENRTLTTGVVTKFQYTNYS